MGFNRGHFFSALAGLIVGALLIGALPGLAANGDPMLVGEKNNATRATKITSRGGLHLNVGRAGNPALTLNVIAPTPPMVVNSTGLVTNLNADLLDGRSASDFASSLAVDERLDIGESAVLATVAGVTLTVECVSDGGGGSTGTIVAEATAPDLHAVYRDPITLSALNVTGWNAHQEFAISETTTVVSWDPDKTKQTYWDAWTASPRLVFSVWSPAGGLIDGNLVPHLSAQAAPNDCVVTGHLIASG